MQIYPALMVSSLSAAWPFWESCQAAAAASILLLFICPIPHGKTGQAGNLLELEGNLSSLLPLVGILQPNCFPPSCSRYLAAPFSWLIRRSPCTQYQRCSFLSVGSPGAA